jgi:hypothetical protein
MLLRSRLTYMNRRGHHQIYWEATLHRAMQTAIAAELRARYEPPRESPQELLEVHDQTGRSRGGCAFGNGAKTKMLTGITGFGSDPGVGG